MAIFHKSAKIDLNLLKTKRESAKTKWILQNLAHPILVPISTFFMNFPKLGGAMLQIFQKIGLLNKVYTPNELKGQANNSSKKLPNALATLALQQIKYLEKSISHRKVLSENYNKFFKDRGYKTQEQFYQSQPARLRFTIKIDNPKKILNMMKKKGYVLGNWYNQVIMPNNDILEDLHYKKGNCLSAEEWSDKSLNLPTHHKLSVKKQERLLKYLKNCL